MPEYWWNEDRRREAAEKLRKERASFRGPVVHPQRPSHHIPPNAFMKWMPPTLLTEWERPVGVAGVSRGVLALVLGRQAGGREYAEVQIFTAPAIAMPPGLPGTPRPIREWTLWARTARVALREETPTIDEGILLADNYVRAHWNEWTKNLTDLEQLSLANPGPAYFTSMGPFLSHKERKARDEAAVELEKERSERTESFRKKRVGAEPLHIYLDEGTIPVAKSYDDFIEAMGWNPYDVMSSAGALRSMLGRQSERYKGRFMSAVKISQNRIREFKSTGVWPTRKNPYWRTY